MRFATLALSLATLAGAPAWADEWVKCATEAGYCRVDGTAIVKYGAGKQWATRRVTGGVKCSPAAFGDPAVGVHKACYIVYAEAYDRRSEFTVPPTWVKCASEGGVCRFEGRRRVSYGAGKKWVQKVAVGNISCSTGGFGKDPAFGVVKSCYYDAN